MVDRGCRSRPVQLRSLVGIISIATSPLLPVSNGSCDYMRPIDSRFRLGVTIHNCRKDQRSRATSDIDMDVELPTSSSAEYLKQACCAGPCLVLYMFLTMVICGAADVPNTMLHCSCAAQQTSSVLQVSQSDRQSSNGLAHRYIYIAVRGMWRFCNFLHVLQRALENLVWPSIRFTWNASLFFFFDNDGSCRAWRSGWRFSLAPGG